MKCRRHDPVFHMDEPWHDELEGPKDPGWYFWDETWSSACGPFDTEEQADEACSAYAKTLQ